jgi:hypothetical protein
MPGPVDGSVSTTGSAPTPTFTAVTFLSDHQPITSTDDQSWSRVERPRRIGTATQAELVQRYTLNIVETSYIVVRQPYLP